MEHNFLRVIKDRKKRILIFLVLLLPSGELFQHYYEYLRGGELASPLYNTFLASTTLGHVLVILFIWFMPVVLSVIVVQISLEDYSTGYRNIVIVKYGKSRYVKNHLRFSFCFSFLLILVSLLLNLMFMMIFFHDGNFPTQAEMEQLTGGMLYENSIAHPLIANVAFILVTACVAGAVSMAGTALGLVLKSRKSVYAITFAMWFGLIAARNSLAFVFQPFAEYDYHILAPILLMTLCFYGVVTALSYLWEVKVAEI